MKNLVYFLVILFEVFSISSNLVYSQSIGNWTFTEMSGTSLIDHSGNGNNGEICGATWQQPSGVRSLLFDGDNDYISVPHNSIFNFGTDDFTIEIQFETSIIPTTWATLFSKHNTANWHDMDIFIQIEGNTGRPYVGLSDGTGYFEIAYGTTNVCDGLFHTLIGIRSGNQLSIYIDGDLEETVSASINPDNTNPINIGRTSYAGGSGYFNGIINEVSLWPYSLIVTSVEENTSNIVNYFNLRQNYPNPFNPVTSIQFSILEKSLISLKIFDVLGNEITTLVNAERYPGTYKIIFNASSLSSGIYFYSLSAGDFVETKKMILLK